MNVLRNLYNFRARASSNSSLSCFDLFITLMKRFSLCSWTHFFSHPNFLSDKKILRFKSSGSAVELCRSERVRPRLAAVALAGLLMGQTLVPCGILLSEVHAQELRRPGKNSFASSPVAIPQWAKNLEQRAVQEELGRKLRLAQLDRPGKDDKQTDSVAADLECLDCESDANPLDLSDVPTEAALRRAGGREGALYPMRRADTGELGLKLDLLLKRVGVEDGLKAELSPRDPRYTGVQKARARYERAREINTLFGRAVAAWKQEDRAQARELFAQYITRYPQSPWAGEAMLHLGYDAKNNGRLIEAQEIFTAISEKTADKPNEKLRAAKRQRKARGGAILDAEREADVKKALAATNSLEDAVSKLDSSEQSDDDDESFEIHMKARQQLADIDLVMGHFDAAGDKLGEIMEQDTNWERRVWARTQSQRADFLKSSGASLMACGPQALGMVMVGLHKTAGADKIRQTAATRSQGVSMADLQNLAWQNGVKMRGFRADVGQLSKIPLPAILHYDFGSDSSKSTKSGHFVTLQGVDSKSEMVRLFDPLLERSARISYAQLNRQWSGQGLSLVDVAKGGVAVGTALSKGAMNAAIGSSTTLSPTHDLGDTPTIRRLTLEMA